MGNICCQQPKTSKDLHRVETIRYKSADQGHVFEYWDTLTEEEKDSLLEQLGSFDPKTMNKLYNEIVKKQGEDSLRRSCVQLEENNVERVGPEFTYSVPELKENEPEEFKDLYNLGLEKIKKGRVTCVILAGGMGSRLGYNHPKGMYNIGLPSQKSIFQILAERFLKAQMLAHETDKLTASCQKCKLIIMTSKDNHHETVKFFKDH